MTDTDRIDFIESEAVGAGFTAFMRHRLGPPGATVYKEIGSEWSVDGTSWYPTFRDAVDAALDASPAAAVPVATE